MSRRGAGARSAPHPRARLPGSLSLTAEVVKRAQRLLRLPRSAEPPSRPSEPGEPGARWPLARRVEQDPPAPLPAPRPTSASAVWRNRTDVPPGSLLHRMVISSGIASVIGPMTVARACKRAGVDVGVSSPSALERALPALRDTLRLFLREADTERRIQKMAELLHAA